MRRETNYRKKQVIYVIPVREFLRKLGIPEELATIHWSTSTDAVRVSCRMEEKDGQQS